MLITCAQCGNDIPMTRDLLQKMEEAVRLDHPIYCPAKDCDRQIGSATLRSILSRVAAKRRQPKVNPKAVKQKSAKALGGAGILTQRDLVELSAGAKRVADMMGDGLWYEADEIRTAAGENGRPASEGLRRLRELRDLPGIVVDKMKKPGASRIWLYRLRRVAKTKAGAGA